MSARGLNATGKIHCFRLPPDKENRCFWYLITESGENLMQGESVLKVIPFLECLKSFFTDTRLAKNKEKQNKLYVQLSLASWLNQ